MNEHEDSLWRTWRVEERVSGEEYDGVVGSLPDWVPEGWQRRFRLTRQNLLAKCHNYLRPDEVAAGEKAHSLAIGYLQEFLEDAAAIESLGGGEGAFLNSTPPELRPMLSELAHIQAAIEVGNFSGPNKGFRALIGDDAVQQVLKARRKIEKRGPPE